MAQAATRQLCEQLMGEIVGAARACGVPVADAIIAKMLDHTLKMTPYRTSMKIDFDEHRPMEVEAIFGNPLRAAQSAGAAVPRLEMLYHLLQFLDAGNR